MIIDLTKFHIFTDIKKEIVYETNVKDNMANALYMGGQGLAFHALAFKIYNANNEVDFSDKELSLLLSADGLFTCVFIDSLKDYIDKHKEK